MYPSSLTITISNESASVFVRGFAETGSLRDLGYRTHLRTAELTKFVFALKEKESSGQLPRLAGDRPTNGFCSPAPQC